MKLLKFIVVAIVLVVLVIILVMAVRRAIMLAEAIGGDFLDGLKHLFESGISEIFSNKPVVNP